MEKYYDINKEGFSIRCKLYCNDIHSIEKMIVYFHGFGGHKETNAAARFAGQLISKYKKTALLTFDLPCHGKDARKKMNLEECNRYIELVNEDVKERFHVEEIYAYGTSFGGYLILKHIYEKGNPYKKIALRCPAISFYETITKNIMTEEDKKKLEKGKEILVGFDRKVKMSKDFLDEIIAFNLLSKEYIDFAEDILIIHGTKDEIVDFEVCRDFAEQNIIEFIEAKNADHRFKDPVKMDQASTDIMKFFELNQS